MRLTLADVERCMSGMAEDGHETVLINTVQTDSRTVSKGDLFVCIDGENFDGHEFAAQAVSKGAAAVVSCKIVGDLDVPVVMVRDTTRALGQLASCWRDLCGAKLVAVTGTAGKTTVKEMLYAVVSRAFPTAKNYRNHNNQIGLPMSMLKATSEQDVWIMELGISVQGDMEELAPIASPDLAIITNVGPGHLEGLGNEAGVAVAKTALLKFLRQTGEAIICQDYPVLWDAAREIVNPIGFSSDISSDAPYAAAFLGADGNGHGRFRLRTPNGESDFTAPFCGVHYAENLAAVAAAAHQLGLTLEDVVTGVQDLAADSQRFCCKISGDVLVIDDTYNANPLSMERSIRTAADMAGDRPLVLILGEMRELGAEAAQRHEELGAFIKDIAPHAFFYKGAFRENIISGLGRTDGVVGVSKPNDFMDTWREMNLEEAVVLVKGSRSLNMEAFANELCRCIGATAGNGEA